MPHFIIFSVLFLCALVVSCVLTSCQPLVRPFRPEEKTASTALFRLRDAGGIVVRRVEGMPEGGGAALVESLIAELQHREIPAAPIDAGVNRRSMFLDAAASAKPIDAGRLAVAIDWTLTDADGHILGRPRTTAQVARADWGGPGRQAYAMLARRAVGAIAALVEDPTVAAVEAPEPKERRLYVWPVSGAPGDGGPALSRAMSAALRGAKLPVAEKIDDGALVIAGSVHVGTPDQGRQKVEIVWTVLDPSGKEIAKLAQANAVAAGALDGDWGRLASLIADAAVPGIVDMLRQLPSRAALPAPRNGG